MNRTKAEIVQRLLDWCHITAEEAVILLEKNPRDNVVYPQKQGRLFNTHDPDLKDK